MSVRCAEVEGKGPLSAVGRAVRSALRASGSRLGPGARRAAVWVGVLALAASVAYIAVTLDAGALADTARAAADEPLGLVAALAAYALAFVIRAAVWCRVLPGLSFGQSLAAIHVSLAGNHVLPLRLGEPLRVVSVVRRAGVPARPRPPRR